MSIYKREDSTSWWLNVSVKGQSTVRMSTDKREAERMSAACAGSWRGP